MPERDDTHQCPGPGCGARVPFHQLACRPHWYQLPKDLRDQVWATYRRHGQGSPEHLEAVEAALDWYHRPVRVRAAGG